MAASSAPLSPSPLSLSLSLRLKPRPLNLLAAQKPFSPLSPPPLPQSRRLYNPNLHEAYTSKATKRWEISAVNSNFSISEASAVDISQDIVGASGNDGVSTIISSLLLIAFVGLTILTVGVRRNGNLRCKRFDFGKWVVDFLMDFVCSGDLHSGDGFLDEEGEREV